MLSKDYNFHFEKAELFYEKGDYNSALLEFERIFAYKDTTDVLNYIGCCYMHLKKLDKAEDVFLFLKNNCPEWETPWFNLGRVYIKRGSIKKQRL